jgi:hypothetical protein
MLAIATTLLWLNILFAEYISAKINPYMEKSLEDDKAKAKLKIYLIVVTSMFWAATVYFWN